MKFVGKLLKILLWTIVALLALALAVLLTIPLWIGPVVKSTANSMAPKYTGTQFNLGEFGLNPYSGRLHVGDTQLFNPEGYSQKMAFTLGKLDVNVDVGSVLSDTIVIREILVKDVFASYVFANGKANITVIQENVAKATGGEKPAADEAPKAEAPKAKAPEAKPEETAKSDEKKGGKKVIIERLRIEGLAVQFTAITVPIPSIELTDIGKEKDGVSWDVAWKEIFDSIMKALGNFGGALKGLGLDGLEALKGLTDVDVGKTANAAVEGVGNALKSGGEVVGDTANAAVEGVGNVIKGGGEAAKSALSGITGLFGGSGDDASAKKDAAAEKKPEAAKPEAVTEATDAVRKEAEKPKDAANGVTDAVKASGEKAADTLKSAGNALKGLFGN